MKRKHHILESAYQSLQEFFSPSTNEKNTQKLTPFQEGLGRIASDVEGPLMQLDQFIEQTMERNEEIKRLLLKNEIQFLPMGKRYCSESSLNKWMEMLMQCILRLDSLEPSNEQERMKRKDLINRINKSLSNADWLKARLNETEFQFHLRLQEEKSSKIQANVEPMVQNVDNCMKECIKMSEDLFQIISFLDSLEPKNDLERKDRRDLIVTIQKSIEKIDEMKARILFKVSPDNELWNTGNESPELKQCSSCTDSLSQLALPFNKQYLYRFMLSNLDINQMQDDIIKLEEQLEIAINDGDEEAAGNLGLKVNRMKACLIKLNKMKQSHDV
jgi:hypothetical protein